MKNITNTGSLRLKMQLSKFALIAVMGLLFQIGAYAQTMGSKSNPLETQQGIIASIAPYNADVRQAILKVSAYPDILSSIEERKIDTQRKFISLMDNFDQNKQGEVYTLTRYPDLLHSLAMLPSGESKSTVMQMITTNDADLQDAAWSMYKKHQHALQQIDDLYASAQEGFLNDISGLDYATKAAFSAIKGMPDVLTLLTNNLPLTEQIGDSYKQQGVKLESQLSVLHDSLMVENQYQVAAFKEQLNKSPQAYDELTQAAQDYALQNGYQVSSPNNYNQNGNYYANPYSYWFGYPTWYGSAMWYPGAYWYDMGLYGGFGTGFGLYGFPSYGFSNWFYNPVVYNRYPMLYNSFGSYYNQHNLSNRMYSTANAGFVHASSQHFNTTVAPQARQIRQPYLTNAATYSRPTNSVMRTNQQPIMINSRTAAGSYHGQAWSSQGGINTYHMSPSSGSYSGAHHSSGGRR